MCVSVCIHIHVSAPQRPELLDTVTLNVCEAPDVGAEIQLQESS